VAKTLQQTVDNWSNSAATAQQDYVTGVQNTTVDVVGRAIANGAVAAANYAQAITSGRWAAKLSAVGTQGWKSATQAKANNYGTGIAAGKTKYQTAMQTWLPIIDNAAQTVNNMPSGTLAASLARANAFATALYNAKRGQ